MLTTEAKIVFRGTTLTKRLIVQPDGGLAIEVHFKKAGKPYVIRDFVRAHQRSRVEKLAHVLIMDALDYLRCD